MGFARCCRCPLMPPCCEDDNTDDMCELLNHDLEFHPHLKYFAAQLLAGCILRRADTGLAIMVNTIEVYGRKKTVDIHREPFGILKQATIPTSLPPPVKAPHTHVWPTTLASSDGPKLVIGTLTLNALITSCIRLDPTTSTEPSVGAVTSIFNLQSMMDSLATRIFVDQESLERALKIAANTHVSSCSNSDLTGQLRQLRTKYHDPTTYFLCRASGPITLAHQLQPYTIFTLVDFDRGRLPAARLFAHVAKVVLKDGANAVLDGDVLAKLAPCGNAKINEALDGLRQLSTPVVIIGNEQLNHKLEDLAMLLQPYIRSANASVATAIADTFSRQNENL